MDREYLEYGLPEYLYSSLMKFKDGKRKAATGTYYQLDCDYCELQSDINVAEGSGEISSEQAWYLREKYLEIRRE